MSLALVSQATLEEQEKCKEAWNADLSVVFRMILGCSWSITIVTATRSREYNPYKSYNYIYYIYIYTTITITMLYVYAPFATSMAKSLGTKAESWKYLIFRPGDGEAEASRGYSAGLGPKLGHIPERDGQMCRNSFLFQGKKI